MAIAKETFSIDSSRLSIYFDIYKDDEISQYKDLIQIALVGRILD